MTGNDDWWDWYTDKKVKARKPFNCGECGRPVAKGETYWLQGGIHEGLFAWHKTCAQCTAASSWLEVVCDGWVFNRRWEDFLSHTMGDETYVRSRPLVRLVRWMAKSWRDENDNLRSVEDVQSLADEAIEAYAERFYRAVANGRSSHLSIP